MIDKMRGLHNLHTLWAFIFSYLETTLKRRVFYLIRSYNERKLQQGVKELKS